MKRRMNKKVIICRFLKIVGIAVLMGVIVELCLTGIGYFQAKDGRGKQLVEESNMEVSENSIIIYTDNEYINKLSYDYQAEANFKNIIHISTTNIYGNPVDIVLGDASRAQLDKSVIDIRKRVSKIIIEMPEDRSDVSIDSITIDNSFKPEPIRMIFFITLFFVILFLIFFRKEYARKIEYAFLVVSLSIGMFFMVALPSHCVSWDEHVHFYNAYDLASKLGNFKATEAVEFLYFNQESVETMTNSIEERLDEMRLLNVLHRRESEIQDYPKFISKISHAGYLGQSLFMWITLVLGAPFAMVWMAGRFGNLLLYVLLFFFAIKKAPHGKNFMALLGLVPTSLFLAVSYAYDPAVIAGIMLGCAIIWENMIVRDKKITIFEQLLYLGGMGIAIMSKAVYAPLVLLALFIPKENFSSKKQAKIFRGIVIAAFLIAMSTFVLPTLFNTPAEGDFRGGSTSIGGQIQYVLGQPFSYAYVLIDNILWSFGNYAYIEATISNFSHLGIGKYSFLFFMLLSFVCFTDTYEYEPAKKRNELSVKFKIFSSILVTATIALIWTALYLSYTEVGQLAIAGVQPRYFLPLVWISAMLIRRKNLKNYMNLQKYRFLLFGGAGIYLIYLIFTMVM